MAGITHTKVSALADGADTTLVRPSDWNAAHSIANDTVTEAMLSISDNTTKDFSTTAHGFVPKGTNTGKFLKDDGTWASPTAAAALSGISAATAANTIANGNNTGQVWNWANTTNSTIAFTFGETSAATGGTSTSGVPNQVLLKLATLAASTQSPLSVYSRGSHVFSVSPSATQILGASAGSANPMYSFAASVSSGMYWSAGIQSIGMSAGGTVAGFFSAQGFNTAVAGSASFPSIADSSVLNGLFFSGNTVCISCNQTEIGRFTTTSLSMGKKIYPATDASAQQTATGIYGNTGAPNNANGADGDFYFRADGGAGTTIYQRRTGTWTGIV